MRKSWIIAGIVAGTLALGGGIASAATTASTQNVAGGRFCVDYGTNVAHYDWDNLPCASDQYVDQTTYSEPVVPAAPAETTHTFDCVFGVASGNSEGGCPASGSDAYVLPVPAGSYLVSVESVEVMNSATPSASYDVPFTDNITSDVEGDVTITFEGTATAPNPTTLSPTTLTITYLTEK